MVADELYKKIEELHSNGLTIIEAIKFLKKELGLSLRDAKILIAVHPAWSTTMESLQPFYDMIEKAAKSDPSFCPEEQDIELDTSSCSDSCSLGRSKNTVLSIKGSIPAVIVIKKYPVLEGHAEDD